MRILILLAFIFLGIYSSSLKANDFKESIRYYIDLAKEQRVISPEKSLEYLQKALIISIKNGSVEDQIECYLLIGEINLDNKLYESALTNTQKAKSLNIDSDLKIEKLKKKRADLNRSKISSGTINLQLAKSLEYNNRTEEALGILKNKSNFETEDQMNNADLMMADIYKKQKRYNESLKKYDDLMKNTLEEPNELAKINSKIAEVYKDQNFSEKSLEYLKKAKIEALESKDSKLIQEINGLISQELSESHNYKEEIKVREQSLELTIEKKDTIGYINEATALAYLYLRSNQYGKVENLINRVLYFAQTNQKHIKFEALAYKAKAMLYQMNGNYPLSNTYYRYYSNTIDTLLKIIEKKDVKSLKTSALFAEKQKQIDLLEKDAIINRKTIEAMSHEQVAIDERISRQKIIIWALAIGIIMVVSSAYLIFKNAQKRRLANQLLALKSLRSQMNPHFIFNALNSVNSFISINDEKSANKYLSDFSKLMRMVMENSQHEFISLGQEIEILNLYLSLEHFRFKNKFDFQFNIDAQIDKDFVSIPPMIIQPHIENAIWHGLRYMEDKGTLNVSVQKIDDSNIKVLIIDNGIGRQRSNEYKTINQRASKSTGIKNTESRIQLIREIYGRDIHINISDERPKEYNTGTRVEIIIPIHINQENYA